MVYRRRAPDTWIDTLAGDVTSSGQQSQRRARLLGLAGSSRSHRRPQFNSDWQLRSHTPVPSRGRLPTPQGARKLEPRQISMSAEACPGTSQAWVSWCSLIGSCLVNVLHACRFSSAMFLPDITTIRSYHTHRLIVMSGAAFGTLPRAVFSIWENAALRFVFKGPGFAELTI